MAGNGLQEFRGQLTLAYLSDVIDMEDYVNLYLTNQSREIFPYWEFNKFDFENWDDTECYKELRFRKDDIANLLRGDFLQNHALFAQNQSNRTD